MTTKVQYKIKDGGKRWEDIRVYFTGWEDADNESGIWKQARLFANIFRNQVRWNYEGSSQGNYVMPDAESDLDAELIDAYKRCPNDIMFNNTAKLRQVIDALLKNQK